MIVCRDRGYGDTVRVFETDVDRARIELRRLLGPVRVEPSDTEIRLYNEQGRLEAALLRAVGSDTTASFCGSGGLLPIQAIPLDRS